jgi:phosphoserine phosphatase
MHYRTVVFDCDSTLSALEGIEHLATGHPQIEELTHAAMRGDVPLEEVYGHRLAIVRPRRDAVEGLIDRYIDQLVDDAPETVAALMRAGVQVRIISGGLEPAVVGLARHLGLDPEGVAAVPVRFTDEGEYEGYGTSAAPARAGGKAEVVREWTNAGLPRPIMFVGDGATDLEARPEVELFVAYAGVVERPEVTAAAPVVIRSRSLAPVLPLALSDARPEHEADRALYDRGKRLIDNGMVQLR